MSPTIPAASVIEGQVLFIKEFVGSGGHAPKDKFVYTLGTTSDGYVMLFVISSQDYSQTSLARETVPIPKGTLAALTEPSWIQCFHCVEMKKLPDIVSGLHFGLIRSKGILPVAMRKSVREVVSCSHVLKQQEIDECSRVFSDVIL